MSTNAGPWRMRVRCVRLNRLPSAETKKRGIKTAKTPPPDATFEFDMHKRGTLHRTQLTALLQTPLMDDASQPGGVEVEAPGKVSLPACKPNIKCRKWCFAHFYGT